MRRLLPPLLLLALTLTGCGDDAPAESADRFSSEVRENFLDSCLDNAKKTSQGAATEEQLTQTCECILGKVEQEYSEAEFRSFEERLLGQTATDEETAQLAGWSTECAEQAS